MNGLRRNADGRYVVPPTYEPYVDAACVVLVIVFLLYLGGHVAWSIVR